MKMKYTKGPTPPPHTHPVQKTIGRKKIQTHPIVLERTYSSTALRLFSMVELTPTSACDELLFSSTNCSTDTGGTFRRRILILKSYSFLFRRTVITNIFTSFLSYLFLIFTEFCLPFWLFRILLVIKE